MRLVTDEELAEVERIAQAYCDKANEQMGEKYFWIGKATRNKRHESGKVGQDVAGCNIFLLGGYAGLGGADFSVLVYISEAQRGLPRIEQGGGIHYVTLWTLACVVSRDIGSYLESVGATGTTTYNLRERHLPLLRVLEGSAQELIEGIEEGRL